MAKFDFDRPFDLYSLLDTFSSDGQAVVVYPDVLPVIASMLRTGLKAVSVHQDHAGKALGPKTNGAKPLFDRRRSMSLNENLASLREQTHAEQDV